jgi:subtilisin family serine protease
MLITYFQIFVWLIIGALAGSLAGTVLAAFSSLGPSSGRLSPGSPLRITKPDVSAPGENINSSVVGGGFASFSGTSMASPHVAGLAALMLEKNPDMLPRMVKKLLEDSCEHVAFTPNQVGYGVINAYAALIRAAVRVPATLEVSA